MRMKKADSPIKMYGWCPKCKAVNVDTYGGRREWQKSIVDWSDSMPVLPHYGCTEVPDSGRTGTGKLEVIKAEDDF
jgi:hypothetical protein